MPTSEFRKSFKTTLDSIHLEICDLTTRKDGDFYNLLRAFYSFIHKRTQTLFLLVQNDCLWDADIILRPIAECAVKFAYICSFNEEERINKVNEFWIDLAEINKLKQSKQAKLVIELTNIDFVFLKDQILSEQDEKILSEKWTKQVRQRKEQPWSYNEMIRTISINYDFKEIIALTRNYTQSSHLIHADETAIGVINDREIRIIEQKEALMNLHEARLLNDCISLYFWLLKISSKLNNLEIKPEIIEKLKQFEEDCSQFQNLQNIIK